METQLAPIPEPTLPADAWIHSADALNLHASIKGRITQTDLERLEAEFLARGGAIQQIPQGMSGDTSSAGPTGFTVVDKGFHTEVERVKHESKRRNRIYSGDSDLVAKIAVILSAATQKQELARACCCSDDKVQRILRTYFCDDPVARPFMRNARPAYA